MAAKRPMLNGIVNRIQYVGIELEGGWDAPVKGEEIIGDGSVRFDEPRARIDLRTGRPLPADPNVPPARPPIQYGKGEIVSPAPPRGALLTTETFADWVRKCYPQHVNGTCGLHVHMSFFNKLNYSRLIVPDYTERMVDALREFATKERLPEDHMLWKRLDPNHAWTKEHCAHIFLGDKQVLVRKKDYSSRGTEYSRYTFINYCDAQHSTIECRGLPMFGGQPTTRDDVELAIRAIGVILDTTNKALSKIRQRERMVQTAVSERPPVFQEFGTVIR
jgi:hypothetical protein